jgi:tetratricopeptide (TPR) repeat protein
VFFRPLLVVAAVLVSSCQTKPAGVSSRLVFVPFEYLGSANNGAWLGFAVPGILSVQTSSITAPSIRDAQFNHADQVVEGYVSGTPDNLTVTAVIRDERTQRTIRQLKAQGKTVVQAASTLAGQLTQTPKPFGSSNALAIQELFSGHADAAIAADPGFGAAHLLKIETLARAGQRPEMAKAIEAAQTARFTDLQRAQLQSLTAESPKARADGVLALARATGYDLNLWRSAAEAAIAVKNHTASVEALQKAAELDPENVAVWNTLAYSRLFAGDFEGAKRSIAEYQRRQPNDPNALDSLGELNFYEGRFPDAEKYFLEAFQKNNAFLGGADLYRAALSRYLAGDRAQADAIFQRFLEFRQKHNDVLAPLREAIWFYTTGRADEAKRKAAAIGSPAAKTQVVLWDLRDGKGNPDVFGDRPEMQGWKWLFAKRYPEAVEYWRKVYESNSSVNGNEARVLLAWALNGADRGAEASTLLQKWPFPPAGPEPGFSSIVMAQAIELKAGHR